MKKNILLIFLATIISFSSTCTLWAETATSIEQNTENDLELSSDAAILMDATTGEILYEKNSNKKEKEKVSSQLKQTRLLNIALGSWALVSVGIMGTAVMNNKIDDAQMLGFSTLGIAMIAVGGVKELKNTVYSL